MAWTGTCGPIINATRCKVAEVNFADLETDLDVTHYIVFENNTSENYVTFARVQWVDSCHTWHQVILSGKVSVTLTSAPKHI